MTLEERELALLKLVADQRDEACRRALAEAELKARETLRQAQPLLQLGLRQRWQDADGRRAWVARCVRQALGSLPAGAWILRHAPGWPPPEQQAVREELGRALGVEPQLRSDADIEAGLIIDSGGACLDGSLRGLLADRQRLEARLLALLAGESQR